MRYETKYLIENNKSLFQLKSYFDLYFPRDSFSKDKAYTVNSLYFDTVDLDFYHMKVEGEFDHEKIRLRSYEELPTSACLERKSKRGSKQFKRKLSLPFNGCPFEFLYPQSLLIPIVNVNYSREAWEQQGLRLTLDFNVSLEQQQTGPTLLEIKTEQEFLPDHLKKILKKLGLRQTSFSKYAFCLENCSSPGELKVWESYLRETPKWHPSR